MKWTTALAKQKLSELLRAAAREPQIIYNRDRPVAGVIGIDLLREFEAWSEQKTKKSLAARFEELREICDSEDYSLSVPDRASRTNPFTESLDDVSV